MIGIITNPNALGLVRDQRLGGRLMQIVRGEGVVWETHTPDELREAVREFHRLGVDIIATCGGDGTNLSTLTEIVRVWNAAPGAVGGNGKHAHAKTPSALAAEVPVTSASASPQVEIVESQRGWSGQGGQLLEVAQASPATRTAKQKKKLPQFAILRGGTVNTVARNVGIKSHPEEILSRIVARYRERKPIAATELELLEVNGMYGFLFGAGMPGRFFEAYYGGPTTGLPWAAALAGRIILSGAVGGSFAKHLFEPLPAEITVDGKKLDADRFTLLVAATVPDVGIGVKVPYLAGTVPGRFHCVASSLPAGRMVAQVGRVFSGRPLKGEPHTDVMAREVDIRFFAPQTYTFDGDLFRAARVKLAAGPRLAILTP